MYSIWNLGKKKNNNKFPINYRWSVTSALSVSKKEAKIFLNTSLYIFCRCIRRGLSFVSPLFVCHGGRIKPGKWRTIASHTQHGKQLPQKVKHPLVIMCNLLWVMGNPLPVTVVINFQSCAGRKYRTNKYPLNLDTSFLS